MTTQNIRFFLFAALIVLGMLLYNAWKQEAPTRPTSATLQSEKNKKTTASEKNAAASNGHALIPETDPAVEHAGTEDKEIPQIPEQSLKNLQGAAPVATPIGPVATKANKNFISVKTDVLNLTIDTVGGDITQLILSDYAEDEKNFGQGYVLLDQSAKRYYIAQSGLTGEQGPDKRGVGRAQYETEEKAYELKKDQDAFFVDLKTKTTEGVLITKRFVFKRGSYAIRIEYIIENQGKVPYKGSFYARLKRKADAEAGGGFLGIQTFTGAAIHTQDTPYKKLSFKDVAEKPVEQSVEGGFAAMVEHYFVSAWIPASDVISVYQANKLEQDIYSVGLVEPLVEVGPGEEKTIATQLYAGPEITEDLKKLAPGLELAVDYGILWPICQPIFWLLKQIFQFTGNWGVAIILTTVIIKALFYKLSAASYRSMGNMRKLQPKLEALKERCGDDKQKYSQAMMELYKKEKINPLGGCLPVLVQIPVFIALYYVLLGSVELREAPFMLWITDLSDKDPYYVLPILMGASMLIQQKLNPTPPDPVQAKVMMLMPVVFTVLFLNFPSGLVLYWFVNNMLSIAQQWFITRNIERSAKSGTNKGIANSHGAK